MIAPQLLATRNKGRPVGSKNVKTIQWEALSYSIVEQHTRDFNEYLTSLWNGDDKQKELASNLFLKLLEYFKPKQARIESIVRDEQLTISHIIFEDADNNSK